ncbi:ABC transporter substrate-binding protein [Thalassobacter stenotrophicus]|uniref:ABC transporter substrate-binding protein n=1 Tax=Thalassobacter stenotrophicus TaxID=266809 RepID=UPI0022A92521|nr:ABC transporter substrate-binding protein [Thalassobacter stenotrophicus]UYP67564.1 ABC transporter substrate-binding protein [Thalassobacter stenotrophicus]
MKFYKSGQNEVPCAIREAAIDANQSDLTRREFLAMASVFGATSAVAYSMVGMTSPALAATPQRGGTLRVGQLLLAGKDPRAWDAINQRANVARGWLEYLVRYTHDYTFEPYLLESWQVSEDAKTYVLKVRPGISWNTGEAFTAEHVAANITAWCDGNAEGNSMASRLSNLSDPETKMAAEGAIEIVDDMTVRLNLRAADISIIPSISDYPAAVVHPSKIGADPFVDPVGTGPYKLENFEAGVRASLVRNEGHTWWNEGNGAWLDRIEYTDYGTDPSAIIGAFEADEIDVNYETVGDFIEVLDAIGLERNEALTASTVVIRTNQAAEVEGKKPYTDVRVRKALALAVDNAVILELGVSGFGQVAENHHVGPMHPEYADLPPVSRDVEAAIKLLEEAGMTDYEHELISLEDGFRKDTGDATAAQLRDAGLNVKRTVVPGSTFWNSWADYPLSVSAWGHRPLGVQVYALAYKSGVPWNETAFSNANFDAGLAEALATPDAKQRSEVMKGLQKILQDEGIIIQPYWRSIYNHNRPGVKGAEVHQAFEFHPDRVWLDA